MRICRGDVAQRAGTAHICAPLPELHLSDQAPFGERDELAAGDDEMVERADVDQRQRLLQRLGQQLVRPAQLRNAGGVVRRENYGTR